MYKFFLTDSNDIFSIRIIEETKQVFLQNFIQNILQILFICAIQMVQMIIYKL